MLTPNFTSLSEGKETKAPATTRAFGKAPLKLQQLLASAAQIDIEEDTPELTLLSNAERDHEQKRENIRTSNAFFRAVEVLLGLEEAGSTQLRVREITDNAVSGDELEKPVIAKKSKKSKSGDKSRKAAVEEDIRFTMNT